MKKINVRINCLKKIKTKNKINNKKTTKIIFNH